MELEVIRLDLTKTRQNWPDTLPFSPAHIQPQPTVHPEDWFVLDAPLMPGECPTWAFSKNDQYVRIPLFSYNLSGKADLALAFMVQLGISCAGHLPGKIRKLRLVTGVPVDLVEEDGITTETHLVYWFGLAVTTTK